MNENTPKMRAWLLLLLSPPSPEIPLTVETMLYCSSLTSPVMLTLCPTHRIAQVCQFHRDSYQSRSHAVKMNFMLLNELILLPISFNCICLFCGSVKYCLFSEPGHYKNKSSLLCLCL